MGKLKNYLLATAGLVILGGAFTVIGPYVVQGQGGGNPAQHAALSQQLDDLLDAVNNISTNGDLRGVTQNWDKTLDSTNGDANGCNSDRFTCVFPTATIPTGALVRDNETGLVWERSPSVTRRTWVDAIRTCWRHQVGGRMGFHLPMIEQLASLVDTAIADPALPPMHPFLNIQSGDVLGDAYQSVTTDSTLLPDGAPNMAWEVRFTDGTTGDSTKGTSRFYWCVRGGQGFDGQDNVAAITATHNLD